MHVSFLVSKATKFDKVVRREVCSIQTKGTKRFSFIDGSATDGSNSYLLAIAERVHSVYVAVIFLCCYYIYHLYMYVYITTLYFSSMLTIMLVKNMYVCAYQEGVETGQCSTYGVCFVDTTIGKFHVSTQCTG